MKCPMCGGIGLTDLHTPNVGRCIKCNGSGEIEPTNEEYIRSCTFEELAKVIFDLTNEDYLWTEEEALAWLKEKHHAMLQR